MSILAQQKILSLTNITITKNMCDENTIFRSPIFPFVAIWIQPSLFLYLNLPRRDGQCFSLFTISFKQHRGVLCFSSVSFLYGKNVKIFLFWIFRTMSWIVYKCKEQAIRVQIILLHKSKMPAHLQNEIF